MRETLSLSFTVNPAGGRTILAPIKHVSILHGALRVGGTFSPCVPLRPVGIGLAPARNRPGQGMG